MLKGELKKRCIDILAVLSSEEHITIEELVEKTMLTKKLVRRCLFELSQRDYIEATGLGRLSRRPKYTIRGTGRRFLKLNGREESVGG